jgi:UDPglucose--hexose-1-phosphate uridylyltransferase
MRGDVVVSSGRDAVAVMRDENAGAPGVPHRRFNPLSGRWVLVSAGRTARPWLGHTDEPAATSRPSYDPACYLCPGNERAGGERNPDYEGTFASTNDFPALRPDGRPAPEPEPILRVAAASGTCRVLCFSPRHDLDLALMSPAEIGRVVDLWVEQTAELGRRYRSVLVFENRGEEMGASNPHPHGQLWASEHVPDVAATEDERQRAAIDASGRPLLLEYAELEVREGDRVVLQAPEWLAVVPFWAVWPFEILLMPRRHVARLTGLDDAERRSLAVLLGRLLARYDNLFRRLFPYSMGWHGAPGDAGDDDHWQLHAHVFPPLLRSATTRKFMAGYELLGEEARDLTPEEAAARLRAQPDAHYLAGAGRADVG